MMLDPTQVKFYIITPSGRSGPYGSQAAADMALQMKPLNEQACCRVEGQTADGKTVLLG